MPRLLLLALSGAMLGCTSPTGPSTLMEGVEPYTNAPLFTREWAYMESCSGLTGDLSTVSFYTASKIVDNGIDVRGYWRKSDDSIFLLESLRGNTTAIEHEMMHALLQGGSDHPAQYFIDGPCGNLMLP